MGKLKELRIEKNMTQQEVADFVEISLRSYKSYENDEKKEGTIKYNYIIEQLNKINFIDEEHGVLTIEDIKNKCTKVLSKYDVNFCYLFGSYAKGKETPTSDVDLLDSMMFRMIQISENAKRLSNNYKQTHFNIPWNAISGLRNLIVYDYGNVDLNIVYETLTKDILIF